MYLINLTHLVNLTVKESIYLNVQNAHIFVHNLTAKTKKSTKALQVIAVAK